MDGRLAGWFDANLHVTDELACMLKYSHSLDFEHRRPHVRMSFTPHPDARDPDLGTDRTVQVGIKTGGGGAETSPRKIEDRTGETGTIKFGL